MPKESTSPMSTNPVQGGKVTIKQVAQQAGVSTASVSYVLSGRSGATGRNGGVAQETAQRIRRVAERMGYAPDLAARKIRTGRSDTILLSLTMLSDPWSLAVIEAVQRRAMPLGITPMILADADWSRVLKSHDADAMFVDAVSPGQEELLTALSSQGKRLVVFHEEMQPKGFDVIRSLAGPGCVLAMDHLLRNHHKIAILTTERARERHDSARFMPYLDGLVKAGIPVREDYIDFFDRSPASAYAAAMRLLDRPDRPTAIYATTDFAAMSAINAAQRLGLRVGVDVDVVGVGNTSEGESMVPSLTSVGPEGFFDELARILVARAQGDEQDPRAVDFHWKLFSRESAR
ncbi:LacI family transcriptional regulator [Psychromicrobium silvestre]|uniref:LacI family transcriptional regulator n=1 Tax=Psychromicrobium silvestre TaxID=1645614 RepID=A0A7Y9S804_9MICC|nr:LacI family DNA-binding transcriptional regulator [Psychromicrobium silvestre]NYE94972.1 LacI family transcriptional regulator [Psychromicrobium silvestre]